MDRLYRLLYLDLLMHLNNAQKITCYLYGVCVGRAIKMPLGTCWHLNNNKQRLVLNGTNITGPLNIYCCMESLRTLNWQLWWTPFGTNCSAVTHINTTKSICWRQAEFLVSWNLSVKAEVTIRVEDRKIVVIFGFALYSQLFFCYVRHW